MALRTTTAREFMVGKKRKPVREYTMVDFVIDNEEGTARGKHHPELKSTNLCKRLDLRTRRTPDFAFLRLLQEIPVFVYGEEKFGGLSCDLLEGAKYYGHGYTLSARYEMRISSGGPSVFEVPEAAAGKAYVRGEVYGVQVEHLHLLDMMYLSGFHHRRISKNIYLEEQSPDGCKKVGDKSYLDAFMYLGIHDHFKDKNMLLKTRYTNNTGPVQGKAFYEHIIRNTEKQSSFDAAMSEWECMPLPRHPKQDERDEYDFGMFGGSYE